MPFFPFRHRRRKSPFQNLGPRGLTCGEVVPKLWLGGQLGPRDWEALTKIGVSALVNLQEEQQDWFAPNEKIAAYLWIPAPDGQAPSIQQLVMGVAFIRSALSTNQGVFVHCKAGQGRAPLLCACYLITQGHSIGEAMKTIGQCRPRTMLTPPQNTRLREFVKAYQISAHAKNLGHNTKDLAETNGASTIPTGETVS